MLKRAVVGLLVTALCVAIVVALWRIGDKRSPTPVPSPTVTHTVQPAPSSRTPVRSPKPTPGSSSGEVPPVTVEPTVRTTAPGTGTRTRTVTAAPSTSPPVRSSAPVPPPTTAHPTPPTGVLPTAVCKLLDLHLRPVCI